MTAEIGDLDYILHDFAPHYLLCDIAKLGLRAPDICSLLVKAPDHTKLVLLGTPTAELATLNWNKQWERPFDLFTIIDELKGDL